MGATIYSRVEPVTGTRGFACINNRPVTNERITNCGDTLRGLFSETCVVLAPSTSASPRAIG